MLPEIIEEYPGNPAIAPIDRRSCYRARLGNTLLRVRGWRIAPGTPLHHVPMPSQEVRFSVHNLGIGGMGVVFTNGTTPTPLTSTDRLRLEVVYNQVSVLVEGRLRAPDAVQQEPFLRTGIRFDGNESNLDYHKARFWLSKIMGSVQREEMKSRRAAEEEENDSACDDTESAP